jgi:hypothetical protein
MLVLGCCKTLDLSDSRSAILADCDMRGSAISALTLAVIASPGSFLCLFIDSFVILASNPLDDPTDKANYQQSPKKQSISKHDISFFNSPPLKGQLPLWTLSQNKVCAVTDTFRRLLPGCPKSGH